MVKKLDDIKAIKQSAPADTGATEVTPKNLGDILLPESREAAVEKLDKLIADTGLNFYEGLLGFTDLFNAVFVTTMNENIVTSEDREASDARVNELRTALSKVLNERKTNFIAEDVVVLLSLISEAVIIAVSEEVERNKVEGEA